MDADAISAFSPEIYEDKNSCTYEYAENVIIPAPAHVISEKKALINPRKNANIVDIKTVESTAISNQFKSEKSISINHAVCSSFWNSFTISLICRISFKIKLLFWIFMPFGTIACLKPNFFASFIRISA